MTHVGFLGRVDVVGFKRRVAESHGTLKRVGRLYLLAVTVFFFDQLVVHDFLLTAA